MKTISRLEFLHAWKTVTFLNSRHVCPNKHINAPQSFHLSPLTSFKSFIELIFGGGWCILGETALENSLQSNKLVDRKQEIKSTSHLPTPSIGQQQKGLLVTSTHPKDILLSLPFPPLLTSPIITCPAWFRTVIPLTTLLQVETPITRMLTFVLDTSFMSAHYEND